MLCEGSCNVLKLNIPYFYGRMNIVLTGGSRGIGYETALALASDAGNRIMVIARNAEAMQALQQGALHNNIETVVCDIANGDMAVVQQRLNEWGTVDVLINNAGVLKNAAFTETGVDVWELTMRVNIFGTVRIIQLVLPYMTDSTVAHIVNIGSMGGVQGTSKFPGLSAYSASKAALANLTECLAEELKDKGIKVNCLALGAVNTEMLREAFPGYTAPVGPGEMGRFIAEFATKNHRFMNGKIIPVSVSTP